jgi:hypothetical protein
MPSEKATRRSPIQGDARTDARRYLKMARSVRHCENKHMVSVTTAKLNGLTGFSAKIMHFVRRDADEIKGTGVGKAVMVEPRAEPERTVRLAHKHVLLNEIINDHVDCGKWGFQGLGDRVAASRPASFVKVVDDLKRAINPAHSRSARRVLLDAVGFGVRVGRR